MHLLFKAVEELKSFFPKKNGDQAVGEVISLSTVFIIDAGTNNIK